MSEDRDFKGVWIPKEIWLNKELSMIDKGLLTEISSLDNESHCYATNEYFAEFCQVSIPTITRSINKLIELKYIEVISFNGRQRVIKMIRQPNQIDEAASSKGLPINIYNNQFRKNQSISKDIDSPKKSEFVFGKSTEKESVQESEKVIGFKTLYNTHCTNLPKVSKLTDKRISAIKKIVKKYSFDEIIQVFDLSNESDFLTGNNDRGWKADMDFILREDKFINILEGKYNNRKKKSNVSSDIGRKSHRMTAEQKRQFKEDIASGKAEKY